MCLSNNITLILNQVSEEAKAVFGDKLNSVILYGSYARGDYDENSDVDIMILTDVKKEELSSYREPFTRLCSDLGVEYDLLVVPTLLDVETYNKYLTVLPFYQNVEREGVKIAV